MTRPFAVVGFTFFITFAILNTLNTEATIIALAVFFVVSVLALIIPATRKEATLPMFSLSGAIACVFLMCFNKVAYEPVISLCDTEHHISAVVTDVPEIKYGKYYYDAKIYKVDHETVGIKTRLVFKTNPDIEPYNRIEGDFNFSVPGTSKGGSVSSLRSHGIYVYAMPKENGELLVCEESGHFFGKSLVSFRTKIKKYIYRFMPNENGALAMGLLLGDKTGFDAETYGIFKMSGIMHIVSVSGFHLSLWSGLILEFFKKTGLGSYVSNILACIGVLLFMALAGFTYPAVRSGIMMIIFLFGNIVMQRRDSINSLGLALLVLTIANPYSASASGLQLSALATLGITIFSSRINEFARKTVKPKMKFKIFRSTVPGFVELSGISLVASMFSLPVTLLNYGTFNLISVFANTCITPTVGPCMIFCVLGAIWSRFLPSVINMFGIIGGIGCRYILSAARFFSRFREAVFVLDKDICCILICGIFVICAFALFLAYLEKPMPFLTLFLCVAVFFSSVIFVGNTREKETAIKILNVGNGTAVNIVKSDESALFGCGGTNFYAPNTIADAYESTRYGFDYLIVPSDDKYGGEFIDTVLTSCRPKTIYTDSELSPVMRPMLSGINVLSLNGMTASSKLNTCSINSGDISCSYVETEDVSVLICYEPLRSVKDLPEEMQKFDVIIVRGDYPQDMPQNVFCVINAEHERGVTIESELCSKGVNAVAVAECGNVVIRCRNGKIFCYRDT